MKNIQTETRPIKELFSAKGTDFLIPDYQRAYSWMEDKCQRLWDDFCDFSFPNGDADAFNDKDEYFLGVIITFRNEQGQDEVVDGQQRLTTLLLLMRAF